MKSSVVWFCVTAVALIVAGRTARAQQQPYPQQPYPQQPYPQQPYPQQPYPQQPYPQQPYPQQAYPQQPSERAEDVASKHLGVGYKIGNGLGFVGGDILVSPIDHLTFDLQANWFSATSSGTSANGYGLAPAVQFHFFKGQRSSPYIGVGFLYATLTLDGITSSATGEFFNAGYEWRWSSGLGILLGGGINHLGQVKATNGVETVETPGGTNPNLEVGLRYMFL